MRPMARTRPHRRGRPGARTHAWAQTLKKPCVFTCADAKHAKNHVFSRARTQALPRTLLTTKKRIKPCVFTCPDARTQARTPQNVDSETLTATLIVKTQHLGCRPSLTNLRAYTTPLTREQPPLRESRQLPQKIKQRIGVCVLFIYSHT